MGLIEVRIKPKKAPFQVPSESEKSSIRCAKATADVGPDFAPLSMGH